MCRAHNRLSVYFTANRLAEVCLRRHKVGLAGNPSLTVTSQRAPIARVAPQPVWGRAAP